MWRSVPGVLILSVIIYFAVASSGTSTPSRLRHPVMPFMCVLAGFGACRIIRRIEEKVHPRKKNSAKPLRC